MENAPQMFVNFNKNERTRIPFMGVAASYLQYIR